MGRVKINAALAASALLAVGLTAGCGRADDKAVVKSSNSASATTATGQPGQRAGDRPSAAEGADDKSLDRAELDETEVPGFLIEQVEDDSAGFGNPTTGSPQCRPLVTALGSNPEPRPVATLVNTFARSGADDEFEGMLGTIRVSSYQGDEAAATFRRLRDSATACAGGFRMSTGEGESQSFAKVESVKAPALGDEALAYRLDNTVEEAPTLLTVVRTGDTLSMFFATSLDDLDDPNSVEIPGQLVKAQVEKVKRAKAGEAAAPRSAEPDPGQDDEEDPDGFQADRAEVVARLEPGGA